MSTTLRDGLTEAVAKRQVLVVVGAGVSVAATGADIAGWVGLLENGVSRCEELGLSPAKAEIWRSLIHSQDVEMMISAAELVTKKLGGPEDGEYATWLRDCFEDLRCRERGLIEALVDLDAPIATTNYDNLLEEVTGLRPVTWKHPGAIQRVLQKDEPRIIHLHGHWEEPESVVLGTRSYERVKEASAAQAIQQAVTVFNKLVFVGCGDGLEDPNFEALRAFLRDVPGEREPALPPLQGGRGRAAATGPRGRAHPGPPLRRGLRRPAAVPPWPSAPRGRRRGGDRRRPAGIHGRAEAHGHAVRCPATAAGLSRAARGSRSDPGALRGEQDRRDHGEARGGRGHPERRRQEGPRRTVRSGRAGTPGVRSDGVYWVELGSGRIDEARRGLARRLGIEVADNDPAADDRLKDDLRRALTDRQSLVVLADVPDGGAFEALQVTGANGRTLCTTVHRSVLDGHPAVFVEIDVPGRADAVRLLEKAAGLNAGGAEAGWGPSDLQRILDATGQMPHALALAGATIGKGGRTPAEVAHDLESNRYLHFEESGAAMLSALAALPPDDARRYRQLAVFPEDEPIPLAALERLWRQEPDGLVETLAQRNLATIQAAAPNASAAPAGTAIRVKRALLLMLADDLKETHRRLIEAYADRCSSPGDWATLPHDEAYIWDHLVYHLHAVRDPVALQLVARDVGFLAVHAHLSGPHAVQRDLAAAARLLPEDSSIAWLNRFLETSGHLLAGHPDLAALAASLRLMLLDAPEGIDPGRLESLSLLPPLHLRPLWRRPRLLGALVREACLYETAINALAFSADGRLASGGSKGILRIWDSELLGLPSEIPTGVGAIRALAFAPAGTAVVTGGSDGSVRIWDVGARTWVALADHGEASVCSVAVSPDGSQVASCADDGTVRVSDVGGGPAPRVSTDSEPATAVAYSPNGDVLALGGDHGRVRIWHLGDGRETMAHDVGTEAITSMAFSRDGGLLAFGEQYGGVGMWDLARAGEPVILPGPDTSVMAVAFSATGEPLRLASGSDDGSVRLWRADGDREPITVMRDASSPIRAVAFSPAGDRLASGDVDGRVRIWDVAEAETGQPLDEEMSSVSAIAMSPDGKLVATGGDDGQVRIREAGDGRDALAPLGGDGGAKVGALAFSADSGHLAWTGGGGTVLVWSRQDGRGVLSLRSPRSVRAVAVSRDGRRVAAACADGCVRVWEREDGAGAEGAPAEAQAPGAGRGVLRRRPAGVLGWPGRADHVLGSRRGTRRRRARRSRRPDQRHRLLSPGRSDRLRLRGRAHRPGGRARRGDAALSRGSRGRRERPGLLERRKPSRVRRRRRERPHAGALQRSDAAPGRRRRARPRPGVDRRPARRLDRQPGRPPSRRRRAPGRDGRPSLMPDAPSSSGSAPAPGAVFVGRHDLFETLALSPPEDQARIVDLHGIPGSGKTEFLRQVRHRLPEVRPTAVFSIAVSESDGRGAGADESARGLARRTPAFARCCPSWCATSSSSRRTRGGTWDARCATWATSRRALAGAAGEAGHLTDDAGPGIVQSQTDLSQTFADCYPLVLGRPAGPRDHRQLRSRRNGRPRPVAPRRRPAPVRARSPWWPARRPSRRC